VNLSPEKKKRNLAIALALLVFVALIYAVTIIKIHAGGTP
jgi:hypothetical protein